MLNTFIFLYLSTKTTYIIKYEKIENLIICKDYTIILLYSC